MILIETSVTQRKKRKIFNVSLGREVARLFYYIKLRDFRFTCFCLPHTNHLPKQITFERDRALLSEQIKDLADDPIAYGLNALHFTHFERAQYF